MKKYHLKNCQCLRCKKRRHELMARGYIEMAQINLAIAKEDEAFRYEYTNK
jgi:hypothetical protein